MSIHTYMHTYIHTYKMINEHSCVTHASCQYHYSTCLSSNKIEKDDTWALMHLHAYSCTFMHTHAPSHLKTHTHTHTYIYIYSYIHEPRYNLNCNTCIHAYKHACIHAHKY